jgi:hypothetical protein
MIFAQLTSFLEDIANTNQVVYLSKYREVLSQSKIDNDNLKQLIELKFGLPKYPNNTIEILKTVGDLNRKKFEL